MTWPDLPPDRVLVDYHPVQHVSFDLKPVVTGPPISLVQVQSTFSAASVTTQSQAFDSAVTAGGLLLAAIGANGLTGQSGTITVTDTLGNAWARVAADIDDGVGNGVGLWWTHSTSGGADTVTWNTHAGGVTFARFLIHEFAGVTALDQSARTAGAAYPLDSGALTTTTANELLFGWAQSINGVTTPGTGYTIARTQNAESSEYQVVSGAGTYHVTYPGDGGSNNWSLIAGTFA